MTSQCHMFLANFPLYMVTVLGKGTMIPLGAVQGSKRAFFFPIFILFCLKPYCIEIILRTTLQSISKHGYTTAILFSLPMTKK